MIEDAAPINCPNCGAEVTIAGGETIAQCPQCQHQFFVASPDEDVNLEPESLASNEEPELNALRIRQRMTMVRGAYRSRSYAIIAMMVCAVLAVQSAISTVNRIRGHSLPLAGLYFLFTATGLIGALYCFRKAVQLHQEARKSALLDPETLPDFSHLGDGTERVRNLEQIQ